MLQAVTTTNQKILVAIFLSVIVIGLLVAFYLYFVVDRYSLLYFWDSVSHLVAARKLVDWGENPGLNQIGTVWMPLPHFLLLPFSLIDSLFTTGFAGTALSLPCLALTSIYLYKIIMNMKVMGTAAASSLAGIVGAMLYATNPNILYLGVTSMTEAPFVLFFVASAYYFQSWLFAPNRSMKGLILCSVFLSLATLCRYEAWFLPPFLVLTAVGYALRRCNVANARLKSMVILASFLSFSSIVFWLAWNQYHYGDPFEFSNTKYYSAAWYAENRPFREILFLQPANVLSVYGNTALTMLGPVLLGAGGAGYYLFRKSKINSKNLLLLFLSLPPVFTIISLLIGIGEMSYWFNSRFMVLLSPLVIVMASLLVAWVRNRTSGWRILLPLICVIFVYPIVVIPATNAITTLDDAKGGYSVRENVLAVETGQALKSMYDGNGEIMVLTGSGLEQRIMITSGIALSKFDEIIESSTWKASFTEPWVYDRWLVITSQPGTDAVNTTRYWLDRQTELSQYYRITYQNDYYKIMVLK